MNDLSESKNLANAEAARVKALDVLLLKHLEMQEALLPRVNPDFVASQ